MDQLWTSMEKVEYRQNSLCDANFGIVDSDRSRSPVCSFVKAVGAGLDSRHGEGRIDGDGGRALGGQVEVSSRVYID